MTPKPTHRALEDARSREAAGRLRIPWRKSSGAFSWDVASELIVAIFDPRLYRKFRKREARQVLEKIQMARETTGPEVNWLFFETVPPDLKELNAKQREKLKQLLKAKLRAKLRLGLALQKEKAKRR